MTYRNLVNVPGSILICSAPQTHRCADEYSTDVNDYWDVLDDRAVCRYCEAPMIQVVKRCKYVRVRRKMAQEAAR